MNWKAALDFCQNAGLQAASLGASKSEEEVESLMELAITEGLDTFWVAGYVMHPVDEDSNAASSEPSQMVWATDGMAKPEPVTPGTGHWSNYGLDGKAQPDNYLFRTTPEGERDKSKKEMCVAVKVVENEVRALIDFPINKSCM